MSAEENLYNKSLAISWMEIHQDAKKLGEKLLGVRKWDRIVAVTRGGLIPAGIVARVLKVRWIDTVCVMAYDDEDAVDESTVSGIGLEQHDSIEVIKGIDEVDENENILIIDDLVDKGDTAKLVRKWFPNAHLAVLYAKPEGKPQADTYIRDIAQETWIYFPWELEPNNPKS